MITKANELLQDKKKQRELLKKKQVERKRKNEIQKMKND